MDDRTKKIRRIFWRCEHRGTREVDLLLGDFARRHVEAMDDNTLRAFEAFLSYPDPQMHGWLTQQLDLPSGLPERLHSLLADYRYTPPAR